MQPRTLRPSPAILISSIAFSFSYSVRVETASGTLITDLARAEAIASAGINRAILGISHKQREQRWQLNGRRYAIPWPDAKLAVTMRSEAGKIDINYAPQTLLSKLFRNQLPGTDGAALAATLLDWRDRDNRTSAQGAEANEYLNAGRSYVPANGPLATVSELAQVMGFDGEQVEALRPYITVYSRRPKVDALNAPAAVLSSLPGIDAALAEEFVAAREVALQTGDKVDLGLLQPASRYIELRGSSSLVSVEVSVTLDNGYRYRENAVVRVSPGNAAYEVIYRLPLQELAPANAEAA